jgi:hypothetical protein
MVMAKTIGGAARLCALILIPASFNLAHSETALSSQSGVSAQLDEATGNYLISAGDPQWSFSGTLTSAAGSVRQSGGQDRIGAYQQLTFTWQNGETPLEGTIRLYQHQPLILFEYKYLKAASPASVAFPSFTSMPEGLHHFSYENVPFAAPQFQLGQYGTPWLLFDGRANAAVISPASHFIIAAMHGDGDHLIASGLNEQLPGAPAGFAQQTLMAISPGIRHTFDTWGSALIALGGKTRPGNESDIILKYYGYWTDNGAAYYYRFDPELGYAGTLEAVIKHYREEKIPVRYLQLDSWWYDKAYPGMSPDDHTGTWKAFGGTMQYRADASLFPQGLDAFEKAVGIPFVVHGRWISEQSPYRKNYEISGIAPVGMKWWNEIAEYLEANGVVTYEQDWQSRITEQSPAFSNTIGTGDDFYDHMAGSCQVHRLTMQYCMALPSEFLEASRYGNLTSIRTSGDRFNRTHWWNFFYTSQLGYSIGSWPWTDMFFSYETDNMLIDTLSAGPVGTGDALGAEDKTNIMKAVRSDGVIVKPDVPLIPLDRMYVDDAAFAAPGAVKPGVDGEMPQRDETPFIASTWTDDGTIRTAYVFAFSRSGAAYQTVSFTPKEAGAGSPACVYDYFSHLVSRVAGEQEFKASIGPGDSGYYIVAPTGPSGIALFGDRGKFASMGKERIASIEEGPRSVTAQVLFGAGDDSVVLFGDAPSAPSVVVHGGSAGTVSFRQRDGIFSVGVTPDSSTPAVSVGGEPVRRVSVEIMLPSR